MKINVLPMSSWQNRSDWPHYSVATITDDNVFRLVEPLSATAAAVADDSTKKLGPGGHLLQVISVRTRTKYFRVGPIFPKKISPGGPFLPVNLVRRTKISADQKFRDSFSRLETEIVRYNQ